jgi:DNA (cytosine-5)-methyltransferase 1
MTKILRVGTDCSGMDTPIIALKQLKIPFKHVFSSEIDKYCIQNIKANFNPQILFGDKDGLYPEGDITKRNINDVPDIDLYVCGFPCQPFSNAGKEKGFKDERGNVFFSCIDVIRKKLPTYFILENVKGITFRNKANSWEIIVNELKKLREYGYTIKAKILNTRDYGIPQNRERLYIIGSLKGNFEWPKKIKMRDIQNFIDWNNNKKSEIINRKRILNLPSNIYFVDLGFLRKNNSYPNFDKWSPPLNTQHGLWNVKLSRFATIKEIMKLQAIPLSFKNKVSNTQFVKQIGNSMSVNVLKAIFKYTLKL